MKIQNNNLTTTANNQAIVNKPGNGQFEKLLNSRMQPTGMATLIKDALSDTQGEIWNEIEQLTSDETGQNIDMDVLNQLLDLHKENKN